MIYPDEDPEIKLKDAPKAGATMSMAYSTLEDAKDAYFRYVINIINEIQVADIVTGRTTARGNRFWVSE